MPLHNIAVFCGSSPGENKKYLQAATRLGETFARQNIGLVYGGARVGLMGAVADAVMQNNGRAIGVIPHFLKEKELAHRGLSQLILVDSMHERKTKMHELCDGIIALPGGFGTLEELFEVTTWAQLGLHQKPIGLLNTNGFYDPLVAMTDHMLNEGFIKPVHRQMLLVSSKIDGLLEKMEQYEAPMTGKWISSKTNT